jgi:hypothetical protein
MFGNNLKVGEVPEQKGAPYPMSYGRLPNRFIPNIPSIISQKRCISIMPV